MNMEQVPRPEPRPPGTAEEEAWLREVLTSEAGAYSPDTVRMRAAVKERIAARPPGRSRFPAGGAFGGRWGARAVWGVRLAGVPAGIVAVGLCAAVAVGLGVTATQGSSTSPHSRVQAGGTAAASTGSPGPESSAQAAVDATSTPLAAGLPDSSASKLADSPSAPASSAAAGGGASPSVTAGGGGGVVTAVGTQNTAADNSVWSEEDVAITLTAPVTSFQLTVKVSMSPSVSSTGDWTNGNPSQFDITVDSRADGLYYTWQLKAGQTLNAGSSTFAVQFNHGNGTHNPSLDTYSATAASDAAHGSASGTSSGAF